jgi:hypothetical protein
MQLRYFIRVLVLLLVAHVAHAPVFGLMASPSARGDSIKAPPVRETIESPNRKYSFVVAALCDDWSTMKSTGTLLRGGRSGIELWGKVLPNRYRPRFVEVSGTGYTVTLDDWENTKSPNAIVIYDTEGTTIRTYSFNQLMEATGLDQTKVLAMAKPGLGWWMGGRPRLDDRNSEVTVPIAGRLLSIHIPTGLLQLK